MASNEEIFRAQILINDQEAENTLKKLKADFKALEEQRKRALETGDTKKMNELDKMLDKINRKIQKQEQLVKARNHTMENMSLAKQKELERLIDSINRKMNSSAIKRGSEEWKTLNSVLQQAKRELRAVKDATTEHESVWRRFTKFLNDSWGGLAMLLTSIAGVTMTIRKTVQDYAEMEESMADVRKYTGLSDEAVRDLNEDLKEMNTRTARKELNELAGAAGRLGKDSKEDILEFVDAGNMIKVALGDDLGEGAIDKVGKLAMAFGEDDKKGLRGAMLSTGSAINELSQNSSAQAGYLVDFTARVAGFGKQLGLTQAQIMGFGAVMDENLLRDEMAATAFGNMLTKMQTDTEKFARIAGMDVKKFTDLLNDDANAAILALADNLKKADPQTMMKMLDDMGLDGSRAVGVLSTLADKIDDVRARQELATKAYEEGTSVADEYTKMNETVEAQIEKAKKEFHEISVALGEKLLPIVKYTITSGSMIIKLLSVSVTILTQYRATIIAVTSALVLLTAARKIDVYWAKLQDFWNVTLIGSVKKLFAIIKANPWVALATVVATVVGVIIDLYRSSSEAAKKMRELTLAEREQRAVAEGMRSVNEEANKATLEEVTKLKLLRKTLEDNTKKYEDRKKALDEIKKMVPDYHGTLTTENTLINNNASALDKYISNLIDAAKAQAAFNRMVKLQENSMGHQELLEQRQGNKQWAELQLKKEGATTGTTFRKNKHWGYSMYDEEGKLIRKISIEEKRRIEKHQKLVQYNERRIKEEQDILAINEKQSEKMQEIIDKGNAANAETPAGPTYTPAPKKTGHDKKDDPEKERLKKLREASKEEKAITDSLLAENMLAYSAGLKDYRQFINDQHQIRMDGLKAQMAVWEDEKTEYAKYEKQLAALTLDGDQERTRMKLGDMEREHQMVVMKLRASFADENSEYYQNEDALNEALFQADMIFLEEKKNLYREGSLERMQIEEEIDIQEKEHQLEREQEFQERLRDIKVRYLQQSDTEREQMELNALEQLYQKGLMKEEEYQRARMAIKAQYANGTTEGEKTTQAGANAAKVAQNEVREGAGAVADIPIVGTVAVYAATMARLKQMREDDEISHRDYLAAKMEATKEFCKNVASEIQAAYESINQVTSAASQLYSAQADLETAEVKKKYEKQIAAAGNNQKRVKKLQEKQAKEEAAIKTKYNRKQVKIQIAQALAQTATNALNAYGSAAAIPTVGYIIAPIAAAMAAAAGMIQVAAIKKQAAAQEAGYYEGGFTPGKRYRKEAGVVHEGEFVANHQAVNNPNVLPLLEFIDRAQRNNTVGSLTQEDINRHLGSGSSVVAPVVNVSTDNTDMRESADSLTEAATDLKEQLAKPIPCYVVLDGPEGLVAQLKHLEKLKNL